MIFKRKLPQDYKELEFLLKLDDNTLCTIGYFYKEFLKLSPQDKIKYKNFKEYLLKESK